MNQSILLLGHGSPKKDANNLEAMADILHGMLHPGCGDDCIGVAYMEFAQPTIKEAILERIHSGSKKIVLHPFFLNAGVHVTLDIPGIIDDVRAIHPDVEFIYTEPLGIHEKLAQIAMERINAAERLKPEDIETRSFSMIAAEADIDSMPVEQQPIVKRVIHATADFDFKDNLKFHADAVARGLEAIRAGKDILTDVEMVRTGINKKALSKWGGRVVCGLESMPDESDSSDANNASAVVGNAMDNKKKESICADERDRVDHHLVNQTRSEKGIERVLRENPNIGIIAIGNAPTALLKAIEILAAKASNDVANKPCLLNENSADNTNGANGINEANSSDSSGKQSPLVIGAPVGFVKAVESKAKLAEQDFPYITALGRKGGTPVAVAVVNALIKMSE